MSCGRLLHLVILGCIFFNISSAVPLHRSKRAVPLPDIHGAVTERPIETTPYKVERTDRGLVQCRIGHLPQTHGNHTVCCRPVVCSPGFQIKTCTTNGGKDECEKCQEGYIQLNNISSFNMNDTSCFVSPNYQCPISDTMKSRHMPETCSMPCECKTVACFIGNPCACERKDPCGINQQLNKHTKECEPCPPYSYKHTEGCESCTYNITAFSLGMYVQDVTTPRVTHSTIELSSTKVIPEIPEKVKESQPTWMIIALVVCGLVLVIFLIVIAWLKRSFIMKIMRILTARLCQRHSTRVQRAEDNVNFTVDGPSSAPLLEDQTGNSRMQYLKSVTHDSHNSSDSGFIGSSGNNSYPDTAVQTCSTNHQAENVLGELDRSSLQSEDESQRTVTKVVDVPAEFHIKQDNQSLVLAGHDDKIMCDKSVDNQYSLQQEENPKRERPTAIIRPIARIVQGNGAEPDEDGSVVDSSITSYPLISYSSVHERMDQIDSQDVSPSVGLDGHPEPFSREDSEISFSAMWQPILNTQETSLKQYFLTENTNRKSVVQESDLSVEQYAVEKCTEVMENTSFPRDDISYEIPLCDGPTDSVDIESDIGGTSGHAQLNGDTHGLSYQQAPALIPTSERGMGDGADSILTETDESVEIERSTSI